jgi:hypothetical protein
VNFSCYASAVFETLFGDGVAVDAACPEGSSCGLLRGRGGSGVGVFVGGWRWGVVRDEVGRRGRFACDEAGGEWALWEGVAGGVAALGCEAVRGRV